MKNKRLLVLFGSIFFILMLAVLPLMAACAPAEKQTEVLMRGNSTTSSYYVYVVAATEAINKYAPDLNVTLVSIAGAMDATQRMSRGEVDFINGSAIDGQYQRYKGIGGFEGDPEPDMRLMYVFVNNPVAFVVREDSGITKLEDLEGKDFNPGGKGTSTAVLAKAVLGVMGITPKYFEASFSDAVAAVKDGRIVGLVKTTGVKAPDAVIMELQAALKIRILSWPDDWRSQVLQQIPYYSLGEIPAGTYDADWNNQPILTYAQILGAMALKDFSDDVVYKIVKALVEDKDNEDIQGSAFALVKGNDFAEMTIQYANFPLHAGALKYFLERGFTIPSDVIPPEAK